MENENEKKHESIRDFSWALAMLKLGKKTQRAGWNGKGMYLQLVNSWTMNQPSYDGGEKQAYMSHLPFIMMKTADHCLVPWLCSQTDMLSDDWNLLETLG